MDLYAGMYSAYQGGGGDWWGTPYFYLGPISIPPLCPVVGMTDENGDVWWLLWDSEAHLLLSSTLPAALQNNYTFPHNDGPYLGATGMKLQVSVEVVGHVGTPHLIATLQTSNMANSGVSQGHPVVCPNIFQPQLVSFPESTGWPSSGAPEIPGIPSSTAPPTGGGFAAFEEAYETNAPPLLSTIPSVYVPGSWLSYPWHLLFYGIALPGILYNDGGVLAVTGSGYGFPATGSTPGELIYNGGTFFVVSGGSPDPNPQPLFFSSGLTPTILAAYNCANLLSVPGPPGSGQLWLNGGEIAIS